MSLRQFKKFIQNLSKRIRQTGFYHIPKNTFELQLRKYQQFNYSNYNYSKYTFAPLTICFIAFTSSSSTKTPTKTNELTSLVKFQSKMTDEQNLESTIEYADQLFDENHFQEVYDTLSKYHDQSLSEINWRKARALFQLSKGVKDKNEREKLIRQSYDLVKDALEKDDNNFAVHKWMAIILDASAELDGIKSRITQIETVSKHMQRAVELNPNDSTSWYLLGAYEFGLADLPWIQRKIVSTVFATPPSGTYDKALEYFLKAEEIKEGFYTMNWLMIGKCYYALKDYENAKKYFEKAANCRVLNEDDKNCKEEAQKLVKKV